MGKNFKKLFRCIKNYLFCKRYPFWKLTDSWYDYNTNIHDSRKGAKDFFINYNFTWYDDIPVGWRKAFGKQLSRDIKKAGVQYLKKHKDKTWKDILSFYQIKEKWGELCLYANSIDKISKILEKYELLSIGYCIKCGKPARYRTKFYVSYVCEKCYSKHCDKYYDDDKLDIHIKEDKLTKSDIPSLYSYHTTLNKKIIKRKVNIKKKYGIDFKKLWGLDNE